MQVRDYVIRRIALLPVLLVGTSIIAFSLTRVGGSPIGVYLTTGMSQEEIAVLEDRFNLNDSLVEQYFSWAAGIFRGEWGYSGVVQAPVAEIFPERLASTMELALIAAIIAIALGIGLGTFAGARRDRFGDHFARIFAISGASMPIFWFGILLLILFWVQLGWFPVGRSDAEIFASIAHPTGFYTIDALLAGSWTAFTDAIWHLVLPATTLGFGACAIITRMMRSSLVEQLGEDYVDAARAKGLPEGIVLRRHARRNALIPTVTIIGLSFGFLLQGSVVVEIIFRWPGMGRWLADAVLRGDQATIMTYVLFTSVLFLVLNLVVDVLYAYLDRRVVLGD